MPWLIDGNNLLGLSRERGAKDRASRSRLVHALAGYARAQRTKVTLVFDGDPDAGIASSTLHLGGLTVLWAGAGSDADTRILGLLDRANDPAGYIVVTSDRSLGDRARHRRARVVRSHEFRKTLEEMPVADAADGASLAPDEVADWEDWFGGKPRGR